MMGCKSPVESDGPSPGTSAYWHQLFLISEEPGVLKNKLHFLGFVRDRKLAIRHLTFICTVFSNCTSSRYEKNKLCKTVGSQAQSLLHMPPTSLATDRVYSLQNYNACPRPDLWQVSWMVKSVYQSKIYSFSKDCAFFFLNKETSGNHFVAEQPNQRQWSLRQMLWKLHKTSYQNPWQCQKARFLNPVCSQRRKFNFIFSLCLPIFIALHLKWNLWRINSN